MATPTSRRPAPTSRHPARPDPPRTEDVDPRWIAKALLLTIAAAALLGYLSVCLLVRQGGWQLLLHPSARVDSTPSVPFESIRFDAAESGTPRLTGWWIPAENSNGSTPTILYLHGGDGSLAQAAKQLDLLHPGINIFAIDYRGYGKSDGPHPTEAHMTEDANAALDYLTGTRHLSASLIVPYGEGLASVLATRLSNAHPELPAFIIDTPDPEAYARATGEGKSSKLPMHLLVQEHFDIAAALPVATRPKLLLADSPFHSEDTRTSANNRLFRAAPEPKTSVTFAHGGSRQLYLAAVKRFLDEYVSHH